MNYVESTPKRNVELLRNVFDAHAPLCFHHRTQAGSIVISHRHTRSPCTLIVIQVFTAIFQLRKAPSHTSQSKRPFPYVGCIPLWISMGVRPLLHRKRITLRCSLAVDVLSTPVILSALIAALPPAAPGNSMRTGP